MAPRTCRQVHRTTAQWVRGQPTPAPAAHCQRCTAEDQCRKTFGSYVGGPAVRGCTAFGNKAARNALRAGSRCRRSRAHSSSRFSPNPARRVAIAVATARTVSHGQFHHPALLLDHRTDVTDTPLCGAFWMKPQRFDIRVSHREHGATWVMWQASHYGLPPGVTQINGDSCEHCSPLA